MLRALPAHPVTLTVLASGDEVELYLTFQQPPQPVPDLAGLDRQVAAAAHWCAMIDVDDAGSGCLEVRWQQAMPP